MEVQFKLPELHLKRDTATEVHAWGLLGRC